MHIALQKLMPQILLTRLVGGLARLRLGPLTRWAIKGFVKHYGVNLAEAKCDDLRGFATFNDFFTRELKEGVRPLGEGVISPVDGTISELGQLDEDRILQAKGINYTVSDLLAGKSELSERYRNGQFMTIYLAPKDYHRIHMPLSGTLKEMIYVPGKLFSVNPYTAQALPNLFARNERVISVFETELGLMTMVAVGAMIVGSVSTVWHGQVNPPRHSMITYWDYCDQSVDIERGAEMGYFAMGSTVIVLLEPGIPAWDAKWQAGSTIQLGQSL